MHCCVVSCESIATHSRLFVSAFYTPQLPFMAYYAPDWPSLAIDLLNNISPMLSSPVRQLNHLSTTGHVESIVQTLEIKFIFSPSPSPYLANHQY
jgi:hypothetical protein